jgi:hypothetical protein
MQGELGSSQLGLNLGNSNINAAAVHKFPYRVLQRAVGLESSEVAARSVPLQLPVINPVLVQGEVVHVVDLDLRGRAYAHGRDVGARRSLGHVLPGVDADGDAAPLRVNGRGRGLEEQRRWQRRRRSRG